MTDQELIAYLKRQGLDKDVAAAARIEELEKRCSLYARADRLFVEEINDLEAKLTKAVEALRHTLDKPRSADQTYAALFSEVMWEIRFVLAELEGK